ncbi:MAG: MFS transporter [Pseudomonadota bacterium]|nr:MFS transporter [Pseudomonadota bacterium]
MLQAIGRWTGVPADAQGPALLVGLGHGVTHWIAAFFYLLLPFLARDLGLSYVDTGMLVAVFHLSALTANFVSGLAVDVSGRRIVFQVISLAIGALALFAYLWSGSYLSIASLVVLIGVSNSLWHPPAIAYLSSVYPRNRGYALAVHALCANLGDTIAPLAAGAFLMTFSWQDTAALAAVPALVVTVVLAWVLLPRDRMKRGGSVARLSFSQYLASIKRLLRNRAILGLSLMAGFRSIGQNGLYVFLPLYLVHELDLGPLWMGVVMMAMQLGGLIAAPVAGAWSDRSGRRPVVLAGLTVSTIVIVLITLVPNELLLVGAVALLGFALFAVRPVIQSWLMDLAPPEVSGSATSMLFGAQALLSAIVPFLGGLMADHYGLVSVFYMLAFTMLVANLLVCMLPSAGSR